MACKDENEEIRNRYSKRHILANFDHTGHRETRAYPLIGKADQGFLILSKHNAALLGGPGQHSWIIGLAQTHILHAQQIEVRTPAEQTMHDSPTHILVGQELHAASSWAAIRAESRSRMPTRFAWASYVARTASYAALR